MKQLDVYLSMMTKETTRLKERELVATINRQKSQ